VYQHLCKKFITSIISYLAIHNPDFLAVLVKNFGQETTESDYTKRDLVFTDQSLQNVFLTLFRHQAELFSGTVGNAFAI